MNADRGSIDARSPEWLAIVKRKVEGLAFGVVQIVVHNGRVTQIECTEKTRLDDLPAENAGSRRRS